MSVKPERRVVVVGGGFAGIGIAKKLDGSCEVTVVEQCAAYHIPIPSVRAIVDDGWAWKQFVPYDKTLRRGKVVQNEATGMLLSDEKQPQVLLADGSSLPCEAVVMAIGAKVAFPAKRSPAPVSERVATYRACKAAIEKAKSCVIIGGGAVGVEVAGELAAHHTVTLAARESELVGDLPEAARRYALEALRSKNVRVKLNGEEERGSFDARVACYGARPRTGWLATFVDRDARGFVRVDDRFRTSVDNVWAAGDCVAKDAKQYLAAYAHFEGEYVASMVASEILGRAPPDPYVAPPRIVALALGPDDGVLCYGRVVVLRGRAVPWVKALVERWVVRLWPLPYELFRRLPALA